MLRIESAALERADALIPLLEKVPEIAAGRVTRSAVLRLAMFHGLGMLEKKYDQQSKRCNQ